MGYEVHITRADDWASNEDCAIEPSEWIDVIESDKSLRLFDENGPHFAVWDGDPNESEAWLDWVDGNITTKNPDEPLLRKMLEIAERLNAKVQDDDGELYDGAKLTSQARILKLWDNPSLLSLILSLVTVAMMCILFPLDSFIRQDYPVGTPLPLIWGLSLIGFGIVGVLSWFPSTLLAAIAILGRQPTVRYAWLSLGINSITATILAMSQ